MQEDNRFWKGQNIFVALLGGGVVVVPEHPVWGSVLIFLGALGFAHSIWKKPMRIQSFIWIGALILTWLAIGYDYYDRHHSSAWDESGPIELITDRTFRNEDVQLDGKRFMNCEFENVKLTYEGTRPFEMQHNHFNGFVFRTHNMAIIETLTLLKEARMIAPDVPILGADERPIEVK